MTTRKTLRALSVLLLSAPAVVPLRAEDTWSEPFQGVKYLHRTTAKPVKWDMHLAFIDLAAPGIRITSTKPEDRSLSTPQWAKKVNVQLAINSGMGGWDKSPRIQRPSGPTMGDGVVWPDPRHTDFPHDLGSFMEGDGRIAFLDPFIPVKPEPWVKNLLAGGAILVKNGVANEKMTDLDRVNPRHPRTAIGATPDHKTLILLVVDGRQKHSVGMTGKEMQKIFLEFKAGDAMNLDGGGSSCMYMEGKGVLNSPSDGQPRHVTNHLGIFAGPPRSAGNGGNPDPKPKAAPSGVGAAAVSITNQGK